MNNNLHLVRRQQLPPSSRICGISGVHAFNFLPKKKRRNCGCNSVNPFELRLNFPIHTIRLKNKSTQTTL